MKKEKIADSILFWVKVYKHWYGDNIRIVMRQEVYDKLKEELPEQIADSSEVITIFGVEFEVYDRIAVDFYVTHKLSLL